MNLLAGNSRSRLTAAFQYDNRHYWTKLHADHAGALSAVGYGSFGEGFNIAAYRLRKRAVIRLLARHAGAASDVLEAAVGVGAYAPVWRRLGATRWVGLDIAEEAVAHCRRRYPEGEFLRQDLTAARWPHAAVRDAGFDLVAAIDVLYHLVDDQAFEAALRNLAARVRAGGMLLLSDVFVPDDRQIAPHVKRRSLATYQRVLGGDMVLVDREPVFAVLADPVPRSPRHVADHGLLTAWRLLARAVLSTPSPARNALGAGAVWLVWPLDALLRRLGLSRGVNLELALFRRKPLGLEQSGGAATPAGKEANPACAA
jgi:2-polyprenyl-3-methyl-5-hydroxy-6-metoxy-1,4-benzoquinol methylase